MANGHPDLNWLEGLANDEAIDEATLRSKLRLAINYTRSLKNEVEQCHAKETCCCGDYVKQHTIDHGHIPVSMYDWDLFNVMQKVERLQQVVIAAESLDIGRLRVALANLQEGDRLSEN